MRFIRFIPLAAAVVMAAPAGAQQRLFRDSWFWGVKAGAITVSARNSSGTEASTTVAPTIGAEWLITRTQGALYLAFDHSMFKRVSFVPDASSTSLERQVDVENLRRITLGLMAFPRQFKSFRPYVGAGVGISLAGTTTPRGTFSDASARSAYNANLNERKSGAAPTLIGGVHMEMKRFSVFGQASLVTFTDQFILNGAAPVAVEFGVRYNLAPAKERPKPR
jgi:outer membrane protein W